MKDSTEKLEANLAVECPSTSEILAPVLATTLKKYFHALDPGACI